MDLQPPGVHPDAGRRRADGGGWRGRRAERLAFLALFAATNSQLTDRFFRVGGGTVGSARRRCSRWLTTQVRRGRVKRVGVVQRNEVGRPETLYTAAGNRIRDDEWDHQ